MAEFEELTPEELENVSGGIVVKDGDVYMLLSDDGKLLKPGSLDVNKAKAMARQLGWSDEVVSPKEFVKRFGREYNGDDYWLPNDEGFWEYDDPAEWYWPWET